MFHGLKPHEMTELRDSIEHYASLGDHVEYWQALLVVCDDEVDKAKDEPGKAARGGDHGIHNAVTDQVNTMFDGKSAAELADLDEQIQGHIDQGQAEDLEYWENLLKRL